MELAALENKKKSISPRFSVSIDRIVFKLAGNLDMYNILKNSKLRQMGRPTTE